MSPEHRWLVVIPADYEASQERVAEVMRPRLQEKFPNGEFRFLKADMAPGGEEFAHFTRPMVIPVIGTVGSGDDPGEMRDRPPEDLHIQVQDYVDFLDIAALLGEP